MDGLKAGRGRFHAPSVFRIGVPIAAVCGFLRCSLLVAGAVAKSCGGRTATIVGTPGNDLLIGKRASDVIYGGGGDDLILGGPNGNDRICGGPGDDRLIGGRGYDVLFGEGGDDRIRAKPVPTGSTAAARPARRARATTFSADPAN